jgi:hypothetical protein
VTAAAASSSSFIAELDRDVRDIAALPDDPDNRPTD